jgi:hypothetical protein
MAGVEVSGVGCQGRGRFQFQISRFKFGLPA